MNFPYHWDKGKWSSKSCLKFLKLEVHRLYIHRWFRVSLWMKWAFELKISQSHIIISCLCPSLLLQGKTNLFKELYLLMLGFCALFRLFRILHLLFWTFPLIQRSEEQQAKWAISYQREVWGIGLIPQPLFLLIEYTIIFISYRSKLEDYSNRNQLNKD